VLYLRGKLNRMKHRIFLSVFALLLTNLFYAQTEGSAFTYTGMGVATPFARDYQTLGINPGNLDVTPKYDKKVTLGFAEFGISLYSEILTKPELRQNIFREDIKDFSQEQQRAYALAFANSDNAIDVDATTFGFSIRTNKAGTFAFSNRERLDFYSKMGNQVSEILWLGYTASYFDSLVVSNSDGSLDTIPNTGNIDPQTLARVQQGFTTLANSQSMSQLLDGTKLGMSWYSEYNLGWGKRLFQTDKIELHGGVSAKLLVGRGMLDIAAENGTATAFSAMSPVFNIEYGSYAEENPSAFDSTARPLTPVGMGFGFDLGATIVYNKKWFASIAVNDIGKMTWDGNLYKLNDINLTTFTTTGLESVDFVDQVEQLNGSDGLLSWTGAEKRITSLPTTARLGFGFDNGSTVKAGFDVVLPVSDGSSSMQTASIAIGGEYSPVKWLHLQLGFTQGGNYGSKIPVGLYFTVADGTYEFGVSSRDMVTFFRDNSPTLSMAFGFLRFRF
jgi:hypothetical protein